MKQNDVANALEDAFKAHLPADEHEVYILVDAREGTEGAAMMPIGRGVKIADWEWRDGEAWGKPMGYDRMFPIAEVRGIDGRVFRMD